MTDPISFVVRHIKLAARLALTVGVLSGGAFAAQAALANAVVDSYATNFPSAEKPISEGGVWLSGKATGVNWSDVQTTPGRAFGTQNGSTGGTYADSTAILNGTFGPDQEATGTVFNNDAGGDWNAEVELRLRSTMTPTSSTGYEIEFRARPDASAYCDLVRWNGALGSFTPLLHLDGSQCAIRTGDVIRATMIGNTLTAYRNGTPVMQASDGTFTSGNPGVGFFLRNMTQVGNPANYGLSSFTASTIAGGTPTSTPMPTSTPVPPTAIPAGVSAYAPIQAESFTSKAARPQVETTTDTGGGLDMGYIRSTDWLAYNSVDFGSTGATQLIARVASGALSGTTGVVEVHLDGAASPVGSFVISNTGGMQSWVTTTANISSTIGTHTVSLVFTSASTGHFVNINWFYFGQSSSASPTSTPTRTATATRTPVSTSTRLPTSTPVPPTATPTQQQPYTSSASVSPGSVPTGRTVTINASVKSTNASTVGIAIMVTDPSGAMVAHTLWSPESFTAGQAKLYSAQWTVPTSAVKGGYTVEIGVAPAGWGSWYNWNANATTFTVT